MDRRNPVKFWLAPFLLSLCAPLLALSHDWLLVVGWLQTRTVPNLFLSLVMNVFLIGMFSFFAREMWPMRCPECRRATMIPLRNFWGPGLRTPNTRWCASCGAKYWRTLDGEWREERRRTWLDKVKESRQVQVRDRPSGERAFVPESRLVAPMVSLSRQQHRIATPRPDDPGLAEVATEVGL
jgi:hypothetical protein